MGSEQTRFVSKTGSPAKVDLYSDLLSRFERLLAYASTLQARLRLSARQEQRLEKLIRENSRLKARIGLDDIYIALLEQALEAVGVLEGSGQPQSPEPAAAERPGHEQTLPALDPRLHLAGIPRRRAMP